jgi:hypothetical protein
LAAICFASFSAAAETQSCDERELVKAGTFTAVVKSVGLIVGARWGDGTMTLNNGSTHNFSMSGGKLMEVGAAKKTLKGTVYNLDNLQDFPGTFLGIGGGLAVITVGLGGTSITNSKCVVLNAFADESAGIQASMPIAPGGVSIKLVN